MKILVVVDMQNDFIDGALGTKEAVQIVEKVRERIEQAVNDGVQIVYTRDTHTEEYLSTQEGKKLPVVHCVKGTKGWEISDRVYKDGYPVIDKSSFGSLELAEWVQSRGNIDEIELIGLCTDICVISNAMILKAKLPEAAISVNASCCAGVTPQSHANALEAMKMCQIDIKE